MTGNKYPKFLLITYLRIIIAYSRQLLQRWKTSQISMLTLFAKFAKFSKNVCGKIIGFLFTKLAQQMGLYLFRKLFSKLNGLR